MSRSSKIFGDPLILHNSSPFQCRSSSKDIIHTLLKNEDTNNSTRRVLSSQHIQQLQNGSTTEEETMSLSSSASAFPKSFQQLSKVVVPEPTKPMFYVFNNNATSHSIDFPAITTLLVIILITVFACPASIASLFIGTDNSNNIIESNNVVTLHHVFYSGWITAVATGVGVLPFFFLHEPSKFYTGLSNAVAAGMMIAASVSLLKEALEYSCEQKDLLDSFLTVVDPVHHKCFRTGLGIFLGLSFILCAKIFLDEHEDLNLESVVGLKVDEMDTNSGDNSKESNMVKHQQQHQSAQKMLLIIIVMTLHSLSEGIGIGVSYGGLRGMRLGQFISLSLAVHNIPEGLAVGLVMKARNVSTLRTVLWAIFTSIPQPIFAIPAYLFIEKFAPMLPVGLGFAAGAMFYVAIFELFYEAMEDLQSSTATGVMAILAFTAMMAVQELVKDTSHMIY